jgi:hypothetical protein
LARGRARESDEQRVRRGGERHAGAAEPPVVFVTSQGSAHSRFRRALATGNPLLVRAAEAELSSISLADALSICLVLLRAEPSRYGRAATRFHAGLVHDVSRVEREDAQIALAALQDLRGPDPVGAGAALAELFAALELVDLHQRHKALVTPVGPLLRGVAVFATSGLYSAKTALAGGDAFFLLGDTGR